MLTFDFTDNGFSVAATSIEKEHIRVLTLTGKRSSTDRLHSPVDVIFDGIDQATVPSARVSSVLAPPDDLILTHPLHWTPAQLQILHKSADAVGFPDSPVHVHPKPFVAALRS